MLWLSSLLLLIAVAAAEPVVESHLGKIVGDVRSIEGVNVESFLGIPFAKPPVGDLRFALPEPFGPVGDFDAKKHGSICAQPPISIRQAPTAASSSEDCLYLNVYRKEGTRMGDNKAVIAIIHGGAFSMGSGSDSVANSAPLAGLGDVITVSFNYRLGIFGFADMGDLAPGNLGLFDQRLALEWIQTNIKAFGGNPARVTLLGVSAGSQSISAHIISPLNSGGDLFQSVVMDAGILGVGIEFSTKSNFPRIKKIAEELGCGTEAQIMLTCLRKVSAKDLNRLQFDPEGYSPIATFQPTIDGVFIPRSFETAIRENAEKFAKVRMIVGVAQDEGTMFASYYMDGRGFPDLKNEDEFLGYLAKFVESKHLPIELGNPETRQRIVETYYKSYSHPFLGVSRFISDAYFVCPTNNFVNKYSRHNGDVFYYHFERKLHGTYFSLKPSIVGAFHGSPFLHFTGGLLDAGVTVDDVDRKFFFDSIELISKFARADGVPEFRGVKWPDSSRKPGILRIDEKPRISEGMPYEDHCTIFTSGKWVYPHSRTEL